MGNTESADRVREKIIPEEEFHQLTPDMQQKYFQYIYETGLSEEEFNQLSKELQKRYIQYMKHRQADLRQASHQRQSSQSSISAKLGQFASRNPLSPPRNTPASQNGLGRSHHRSDRLNRLFPSSSKNFADTSKGQSHPSLHPPQQRDIPQATEFGSKAPATHQASHHTSQRPNNSQNSRFQFSNQSIFSRAGNNASTNNGNRTGQQQQSTVNVLMYPATTKRSKFLPDPSKMFAKLSIHGSKNNNEDDDWESRWENDDYDDDDSSEDEDKMPAHPFRAGIDSGHSSSASIKRPEHLLTSLPTGSERSSNQSGQQFPPHPQQQQQQQQQIQVGAVSEEKILRRQADKVLKTGSAGEQWEDTTDGQAAFEKPGVNMFTMLRVLGKGSFGKVVLVRKRTAPERGVLFAMKILRKSHLLRKNQIERTKTERKVLSVVDHPFIMKLHYAFQTEDKLYFVLEYCSGGELFFHLSRYRRFPERVARFYAAELLLAIGHLHRRGIIFRDLKPENVLLDAAGHVKLGDFGLSKTRITDPCQGAMSVCGTPEYMAPEVISRQGHGFCVDYWGLGMLVFEMMTSLPPWYTTNREELSKRLLSAPLEIPDYVVGDANYFIRELLQRDPRRRLGVQGIRSAMEHRFFRDINWRHLASKRILPPIRPTEGWKTRLKENGNAHQPPDGTNNAHVALEMSEDTLKDVTQNFHDDFTRMPVHTEDQGTSDSYYPSGYGNDDDQLPNDTFVGFTFDEIDNHAMAQRRHSSTSSRNPPPQPSPQSSSGNQLL